MYDFIPTPSVVAELDQVTENLKKMDALSRTYNIRVRPHIKPHKSVYFALEQLACGACGITCAKLSEAETMADYGIDDIFIAYPLIGEDKMERLGRLMQRVRIRTEVNSIYGAKQLSALGERIGKKVPVLIEIDGGLHRGGVPAYEGAVSFADAIGALPGIDICGLMYYGGLIYGEKTREGYEAQTRREHDELIGTAELLRAKGYRMDVLSGGNSYSARCCKYLDGITEVRCGNYIFNDVSTLATGFAAESECALRAVSTVVCKMDAHHAIIDAGSKTLTTDLCGHRPGYGWIVGHPEIRITKLNEEHGFVESDEPLPFDIGDKIAIIPNHACVLPNLVDKIYGIRGGRVERLIPIEARGRYL